jgi:hypothetical protein
MVVIFHVFYVCFAIFFFLCFMDDFMLLLYYCRISGGLDGLGIYFFGAGEKYHVFDLLSFGLFDLV